LSKHQIDKNWKESKTTICNAIKKIKKEETFANKKDKKIVSTWPRKSKR